ncbi:glycosyltransferase family protein [Spirosoma rhododendri]|uniref:Glycosyltransferase n=1 Tax=Spirosoma rhododendri TaxID=2728024 RepID=A0A7L5DRU8_9BACT|nr:glycosyltransferase [Spirosoma rhododendri]QJD78370.1 glycosyltransferase [Spirosoma rhododendri]
MIKTAEVATCVVVYNSPLSRLAAIETYRMQVDKFYIIDNSEGARTGLANHLMGLPDVVYLTNGKNEGIASALNWAASEAVAAAHSIEKGKVPREGSYRKVLFMMTSGNLLSLAVYRQAGPFRADSFTNHVDHDYGLRINQAQFEVLELPYLELIRQSGKRRKLAG